MRRYLLAMSDEGAGRLERMQGGALFIRTGAAADPPNDSVAIAGLDAVLDDEIGNVLERLKTGGPLYHAGGPGTRDRADWQRAARLVGNANVLAAARRILAANNRADAIAMGELQRLEYELRDQAREA